MHPLPIHPLLTANQLAQLLRTARKQRGLSQAEVGARLGLSQNRVSHLEGHADQISVKQLLTWCAAVGLELCIAERSPRSPDSTKASAQANALTEW